MSMKKKLGSKLSEGVRQVKSQRESVPAKPANKPASPATKSVTPRAATQAETNLNKRRPRRVWPD